MEKIKFEAGKKYGNDLTIEVLKRTEKTLTIKSVFGVKRTKIRDYHNDQEGISFRSWLIYASEDYDREKAAEISMYNAYHR